MYIKKQDTTGLGSCFTTGCVRFKKLLNGFDQASIASEVNVHKNSIGCTTFVSFNSYKLRRGGDTSIDNQKFEP